MTRRNFAALSALSYARISGANERVRIGVIGVGARGDRLLDEFVRAPEAQIAAVCDLRDDYLNFAARKAGAGVAKCRDYRRVLDNRDVDAVVIATPDHWHAIQFIAACQAGKDVFVEKPLSLTVVEGRRMVEVAQSTGRVVQVGTQRRSSAMIREAVEFIRAGGIGQVSVARAFDNLNEWPHGIGRFPDEAPPADLDWDLWLGPAPKVPYNRNRTFYNYRWFYDYSGGQLTNNGIHLLDVVRWALDLGWPAKVAAIGGNYALGDAREIPDTLEVLWEFDKRVLVSFTQMNANEAPANAQRADLEFRGTKGTLYLHSDRFEVVPEPVAPGLRYRISPLHREVSKRSWMAARKTIIAPKTVKGSAMADREHVRNFLECVKSRSQSNAGIREGHTSTATCLMGNIALKTESTLKWDGARERFTNNEAANGLLHYEYRKPYTLVG